jgi:hypothetical protein
MFLRKNNLYPVLFLCLLIFGANACLQRQDENKPNRYASIETVKIRHPKGLNLEIAKDISYTEGENGYQMRPPDMGSVRYAINFTLAAHQNEDLPKEIFGLKKRAIADRAIFYRYNDQEAGGASGDEIIRTLEAWEQIPNGYIFYEQGTPETHFEKHKFDLLWHVIERTNFEPNK